MENLKPNILVYIPGESAFAGAAASARARGAQVVFTSPIDHAGAEDARRWTPGAEPGARRVVIAAEYHTLPVGIAGAITRARAAGVTDVFAEVIDVSAVAPAVAAGATAFIVCGVEGPGMVSDEASSVLLRRVRAATELPVIVRGGVGPESTAAVMLAGASGVVLEQQLWCCEDWPIAELAPKLHKRLLNFNPTDTRCLGVTFGLRYRVFAQIATKAPRAMLAREQELAGQGQSDAVRADFMAELARTTSRTPWAPDLKTELLALGQCAALAAPLAREFKNTAGVISAIEAAVTRTVSGLRERFPLSEGLGAAKVNATKLPLHQGPMAQVSDVPEFARAVVDAGSMPWLALGNMPGEVAERVVWSTGEAVDGKPFGAGIIGLDANRWRDAHIEMLGRAIKVFPNMMALVAAGTAEQAMTLEKMGIKTYLHTPTPGVLRAALRAGQRHFLLEGTEAGGHIGFLGGLALWQLCVIEIEDSIRAGECRAEDLCVLPAGGISDAASALAAAAIFQGLIDRGLSFGVQMGTAYLMTHEAVATGAIDDTYQRIGASADATVVMGESVGAPTRVLPSAAAWRVADKERDRLATGVPLKTRKEDYEHDNLGGLRAAAKAQKIASIDPEKGAVFAKLSVTEQEEAGLFHAGQAIALMDKTCSLEELHHDVTDGARALFNARVTGAAKKAATPSAPTITAAPATRAASSSTSNRAPRQIEPNNEPIAIVGLGAKLPGALDIEAFWSNLVQGKSAIQEVPAERWDAERYWSPDRSAPDRTYSKIGGWVQGFKFDRKAFRLPPMVVKQMDFSQQLWLAAVAEALDDAGMKPGTFDGERVGMIVGNAMGGDLRDTMTLRLLYPEYERALRESLAKIASGQLSIEAQNQLVEMTETLLKKHVHKCNEDTMPGELSNVIAGRAAQVFDLGGPNFTCDAACASSLAAIEQAVNGLRAGRFDIAVSGGSDSCMSPVPFIKFSKIGALSPDGSRPFDAGANGFVMGEGAAALVLKRLSDAERDGDKIYGLVAGVGASSDGRGKAITAPNPIGQERALRRAYENVGFGPKKVSLFEAHGTSTPVGDPVEVASLRTVLAEDGSALASERIGLGSVKSMIGHLKAGAGAASMVKIALALKNKTLLPTINVETQNPALELGGGPLQLQLDARPWEVSAGEVRRAGVSAFGFGGTNFHVVLTEYTGDQDVVLVNPTTTSQSNTPATQDHSMSTTPRWNEGILGLSADSKTALIEKIDALLPALMQRGVDAVAEHLLPVEDPKKALDEQDGSMRLAVIFESADELTKRLERARKALVQGKGWRVLSNQGVLFSEEQADGKLAMLFPGQGSQYLGMLAELASRYDVVRDTFAEADSVMAPALGFNLSGLIHPDLERVDKNEAFIKLSQTEITQPAVLTVDIALMRLLGEFGIEPDVVAGHSLGEYGACVAAGVMTFEEALRTVALRGTQMANATPEGGDCGLMASVPAGADWVEAELEALNPGYVVCANKNSPKQTIIAGRTEPVRRAIEHFESKGMQTMLLPVSHAFHSEVVSIASVPLRAHMGTIDIQVPKTPILTNVTGDYYPTYAGAEDPIRDMLAKQVAAPVEFIAIINRMWNDGVRCFVEVGPKRAQASFVSAILEDRPHVSLYTNHPKKGDVRSWLDVMANLWVAGMWTAKRAAVAPVDAPANVATAVTRAPAAAAPAVSATVSKDEVYGRLLQTLCEKTGYDADEIEGDFELEADLGIDTVKQAEIIAAVRDHYKMERDEDFRLADYPTLNALAQYVLDRLGQSGAVAAPAPVEAVAQESSAPAASAAVTVSKDEVYQRLLETLCEKTGYDADEIEGDFELEADLGIDTVKQAEIIAAVRDHYKMERDEDFRLADYPTLNALAQYVLDRLGQSGASAAAPAPAAAVQQVAPRAQPAAPVAAPNTVSKDEVYGRLLDTLCEKTGYDADEIEGDFELEADLGIDTVKQAEIIAAVRDHYKMERDEDFRLADYPTLNALAQYVLDRLGQSGASAAAPAPAPAVVGEPAPVVVVAAGPAVSSSDAVSKDEVYGRLLDTLCEKTGYDADEIEGDFELEADLGIDTVKQAEIIAAVRDHYKMERDEDFRLADYPTLNGLTQYVLDRLGAAEPMQVTQYTQHAPSPAPAIEQPVAAATPASTPAPIGAGEREVFRHAIAAPVAVTGCALGLPGIAEVFDEHAIEHIMSGENMISNLSDGVREDQVSNRITRLVKHKGGGGEMVEVSDPSETIKLAGQLNRFDLEEDWGVPNRVVTGLDRTSQMAFAAGINALRDAKIPLVPRYRTTSNGSKITIGWQLPGDVGRRTGIIFASAFSSKDMLADELKRRYTDPEYTFDHKFMLKLISMGGARLAEYIGARGPNTTINSACSSTTVAMGIAEDWIKAGRCERVLVIAADNVSGSELAPWITSGFLATGAATTQGNVEEAALPFDRRRNGMIIGAGAVGFVMERDGLAEERGVEPIADVLATKFLNSATHPTRLDVDHIAEEVDSLLVDLESTYKLDREEIAGRTMFMSHETYTPARGGSAAAEIAALRTAFGANANQVVVSNTKGLTGHSMAASIEDVVALKALQFQRVPPVANLREPDPDLGDLRLSQGGEYHVDYALRFSAGFGSQLGLAFFRWRARTEDRVFNSGLYNNWLREVSGFENPVTEVVQRTLRSREARPEDLVTPPVKTPQRFSPRFVSATSAPLTPASFASLSKACSGKSVAILAHQHADTEGVRRALVRHGASVSVLLAGENNLHDEAELARLLAGIAGVVNLLGVSDAAEDIDALSFAGRAVYHTARAWEQALGRAPGAGEFWVSATQMGGALGFDFVDAAPLLGGVVGGATKSLAREWADARVANVDLERGVVAGDAGGLRVLAQCLLDPTRPVEVGVRRGLAYLPHMADGPSDALTREVKLDSSKTLIITGGARGITANVAIDLARRFGCKLALVGSRELTFADPLSEDVAAYKAKVKQDLIARGERVTPMAIKRVVNKLVAQQEVARNMQKMRAAGSEVEYFACDLRDANNVTGLVESVRARFGRVDGVIYGAGVEISHLLQQKDVAEFDLVFNVKVQGAKALWELLGQQPGGLECFVSFSSIAGRFGNVGQIDYSAANDFLGKLTSMINTTTSTYASVIDWTAWADIGMASRGSMPDILTSRGVEFLPVELGEVITGELLSSGLAGEFVVAEGLGEFVSASDEEHQLLVDELEQTQTSTTIRRRLDPATDRFMRDHVYEGNPLMPGVMGLEMMAQAARERLGVTAGAALEVRDVEFARALKLHRGEPQVAVANATDHPERGCAVEVITSRKVKTGREVSQQHFTSQINFAPVTQEPPTPASIDPTVGGWKRGPGREEIYKRFFHEGTFQVLDEIPCLSDDAIIGYARLGEESLVAGRSDASLLTDPLAREAAFQVTGLWGMINHGVSYLPYKIEHGVSFGRAEVGMRFVIRAIRSAQQREGFLAFERVEICDELGNMLHVMYGVEMVGHQPLREDQRFGGLWDARWTSLRVDSGMLQSLLAGTSLDTLLSETERTERERLISERRRNEWLAARVAAKELARCWARDFFGAHLMHRDFVILKDQHGAPSLAMREGVAAPGPLPFVTMSHSNGVACASISAPGQPSIIGVDLELIETREPAFARDYFDEQERSLTLHGARHDAMITALWCCKEAVSKALGLGLKLRASDIVVRGFADDNGPGVLALVELRREALEVCEHLGAKFTEVRLFIERDYCFALAKGVNVRPEGRVLSGDEIAKLPTEPGLVSAARSTRLAALEDGLPAWRH